MLQELTGCAHIVAASHNAGTPFMNAYFSSHFGSIICQTMASVEIIDPAAIVIDILNLALLLLLYGYL